MSLSVDLTTLLGAAAALCSTTSFAPQAWKVIKSRDTRSISGWMYGVTVTGFGLWFFYGLQLGSWPLIVTNSICFLLSGFILVMKLLPNERKEEVADTLDPES
jgi:MtN3 and saliva related transmembrane protein